MNYADIKTIDVQDGTGVRVSIYVSGCHFHCKGCHNKEACDFNYGKKYDGTTIDYILDYKNLNPKYITIHREISKNIDNLIDLIHSYKISKVNFIFKLLPNFINKIYSLLSHSSNFR